MYGANLSRAREVIYNFQDKKKKRVLFVCFLVLYVYLVQFSFVFFMYCTSTNSFYKIKQKNFYFCYRLTPIKCADNEDFYNLLTQIIIFQPLPTGLKKKKIMRTQLRRSAELSRISSLKACRSCLKEKELIVSRVTRVKLLNQNW